MDSEVHISRSLWPHVQHALGAHPSLTSVRDQATAAYDEVLATAGFVPPCTDRERMLAAATLDFAMQTIEYAIEPDGFNLLAARRSMGTVVGALIKEAGYDLETG